MKKKKAKKTPTNITLSDQFQNPTVKCFSDKINNNDNKHFQYRKSNVHTLVGSRHN